MSNLFTEEYYMDGVRAGLSNYENYEWMESLTVPACKKLALYLGMHAGDSLIDIGCARGFYVKAFRRLGYRAYGFDISEWAIQHCDPEVAEWVSNELPKRAFDWATLKDVAEHLSEKELYAMVNILNYRVTKGILLIVPLAAERGGAYVRSEDEADVTHIIRWTLDDWARFLEEAAPDFNVNASYDIYGIKPASTIAKHSCGFLTLIRP